jgi:hypothetical protein
MSTFANTVAPPVLSRRRAVSSRQLYMILFPTILLCVAAVAVDYDSDASFAVASFAIALISLFAFGDLMFGSSSINCGKIIAIGLSMGYGLSSFNTWWNVHDRAGGLSVFAGVDQTTLCNGIAVVAVAVALLFASGEALGHQIRFDLGGLAMTQQAKWFVLTSFAVVVAAFVHGDLTYMGQEVSVDNKITVLGSLGAWLVPPLFGMTFAVATGATDRVQRLFFWLLLVSQALLAVPLGRRVFGYTLFVGGLVARFVLVRRKGLVFKRVLAVGIALAGMYVASIAFLYIRFAGYELNPEEHHSLPQLLNQANDLSQRRGYSEVAEALKENTLERGFILGFVADLVKQSTTHPTAGGQDVVNSLTMLIPSVVWKDKSAHLPPAEEDLANSVFGTNYPDSANSVLSAGLVDFGLVGVFLYPLIAMLIMMTFLIGMARYARPITATIVSLSGIYLMLNAELDFGDYVGFVRNSLLFAFILYLVSMVRPVWKGSRSQIDLR